MFLCNLEWPIMHIMKQWLAQIAGCAMTVVA